MKRLLIIFLVLSLPIGAFASGMFDAMNAKNILADIDVQNVTPKDNNEQKEEKKEEENKKEKKQIIKNVANTVREGVSTTVKKVKGGINKTKDRLSASGRATAKINRKAENAKKNIDKFCKKKKNSTSIPCNETNVLSTNLKIMDLINSLPEITDDNADKELEKFETDLSIILTDAGFKDVDKETNEQEKDAENEDDVDDTETEDDATPEKKLTKEQQEQKVAELRENYEDMKEIENSFENRTLGATGMATMGMGGMQLATSLAEDKADDAAEQQMKAYLATFSCTYANGKRFKGGESAIELPGGNELINLYSEYVGLANDLKERKSALGMRAGIESEPILDSATSGLYDDISVGKTSGAFTSLARALSDPNSEDAAAWAAQRAETAEKKKNALTTIGAGAVATIAGNLLINSNNPEERSAEILKKYEKLKTELNKTEQRIKQLQTQKPDPQTECPDNATETYPNCTCSGENMQYNKEENSCNNETTTPNAQPTQAQPSASIEELTSLPTDNMFKLGEYTLTDDAKEELSKTNVSNFTQNNQEYCIEIKGQSNNTPWKKCNETYNTDDETTKTKRVQCNNTLNSKLAYERAKAVAKELKLNESFTDNKIIYYTQNITCTDTDTTQCRNVKISACDADSAPKKNEDPAKWDYATEYLNLYSDIFQ